MKVFGHHLHLPILVLLVVEFGGAALAFGASVLLVVPQMQGTAGAIHGPVLLWSLAFSVAVVVGVTAVGLYQAKQRLKLEGVVVRLGVGLGLAAIFLALVNFFFPLGATGALWAWSFAISLVLLATTRTVFARYADHSAFTRRVLVYGAGKRAARILKLRRRSDRRGFEIMAFVPAIGDT